MPMLAMICDNQVVIFVLIDNEEKAKNGAIEKYTFFCHCIHGFTVCSVIED